MRNNWCQFLLHAKYELTPIKVPRTDDQGRYRIVLTGPRWAASRLKSLALAAGFKLATGTVNAGAEPATADFTMSPEPWKMTQIRLVDLSGRPAPGIELTCCIPLGVPWSQLVTDAEGWCRFTWRSVSRATWWANRTVRDRSRCVWKPS